MKTWKNSTINIYFFAYCYHNIVGFILKNSWPPSFKLGTATVKLTPQRDVIYGIFLIDSFQFLHFARSWGVGGEPLKSFRGTIMSVNWLLEGKRKEKLEYVNFLWSNLFTRCKDEKNPLNSSKRIFFVKTNSFYHPRNLLILQTDEL